MINLTINYNFLFVIMSNNFELLKLTVNQTSSYNICVRKEYVKNNYSTTIFYYKLVLSTNPFKLFSSFCYFFKLFLLNLIIF